MCEICVAQGFYAQSGDGRFRLTDHLKWRCNERRIPLCDVAHAIAFGDMTEQGEGTVQYQLGETTRAGEPVSRTSAIGVVVIVTETRVVTTTYRKEVRSNGSFATLGDQLCGGHE